MGFAQVILLLKLNNVTEMHRPKIKCNARGKEQGAAIAVVCLELRRASLPTLGTAPRESSIQVAHAIPRRVLPAVVLMDFPVLVYNPIADAILHRKYHAPPTSVLPMDLRPATGVLSLTVTAGPLQ